MSNQNRTARNCIGALALLGALVPASASASCEKEPSDKCRKEEIRQLDRQVKLAFVAAVARLDETSQDRLRADQNVYDSVRKSTHAGGAFDLGAQMSLRRDFLHAITIPKEKWVGHWANATGTVHIEPAPAGMFKIRVSSAEPSLGAWICEFEDSGMPAGQLLIAGAQSAALAHGGPNEGWTLALRRSGNMLMIEALAPFGKPDKPPFCHGGGNVSGGFFAQGWAR